MKDSTLLWSEAKNEQLQKQLVGFWASDNWHMADSPLWEDKSTRRQALRLHFDLTSPPIKAEVKYACWRNFSEGKWSLTARASRYRLAHIIEWLNIAAPHGHSLLERPLGQWEMSLRSYLSEKGIWYKTTTHALNAKQELVTYQADDQRIYVFRKIYRVIEQAYDNRSVHEKDVWDLRQLGYKINQTKSEYRLNFTRLMQPWLRNAAKEFIRYCLSHFSHSNSQNHLFALNTFSIFLSKHHPNLLPGNISRPLILEYIGYLASRDLANQTRKHYLCSLRTFLLMCVQESWAPVPDKRLIYDEDLPAEDASVPRFISSEVQEQLQQHLDALPTPILRMLLILQECGMRIGELCAIAFDCLIKDDEGDWFVRYYQFKMKKEHIIPASRELVAVIQAQQKDVREQYGDRFPHLFPNKAGKLFKITMFADVLNKLAVEKDIRDSSGNLYHFQAHQWRHTLGMNMINAGTPLHIVQRILGHESPKMTARYAFILDDTLKREMQNFHRKTVNHLGEVVKGDPRANTPDLQVLKRGIRGQTLPIGSCGRPIVLGPCPHANKCPSCVHWLTSTSDLPDLKRFGKRALTVLNAARAAGNQTVVGNQEAIIPTIERRIAALESHDGTELAEDDVLAQYKAELVETEAALEEADRTMSILLGKRLRQDGAVLRGKIAALEGIEDDE